MLYFASNVSSRDLVGGSDSCLSPLHDDDKTGNAIEIPTRARGGGETRIRATRLGPPAISPIPRKLCREMRAKVWVVEGRGAAMVRGQSSSQGQARKRVVEGGPLGGTGCHWTTGFFRFFSFVFRALFFCMTEMAFASFTHTTPLRPDKAASCFHCRGRRPQQVTTTTDNRR